MSSNAAACPGSESKSWDRFVRVVLTPLFGLLPTLAAGAQGRPIGVFPSSENPARHGFSVDGVGDLDGDGFAEVLVGAPESPGTQNLGAWVGRAVVIAGRDGRRLFDAEGVQSQSRFGLAVRGLGDLDGDGARDFAVGAPHENLGGYRSGAVHIYSGKTFAKIRSVAGSASDYMGVSIANAKDVDGDGVDDFFVGGHGGAVQNQGVALLWSGKTGTLIHRFVGANPLDFFGHAVEAGADLDADGTPDVLVGIPDEDTAGSNSGRIEAYSGKTFQRLWFVLGDLTTDNLGHSISFIGDLDADGVSDIAVGAPQFTPATLGKGFLRILSGKTGVSLRRWSGLALGDWFSEPVEGIGDWNGDGKPDVLVGSSRASHNGLTGCGRVDVLSGVDGSILQTWFGPAAGSNFGFALRPVGDFDNNGQVDIAVGAPSHSGGRGLLEIETRVAPDLTIGFNEAAIVMPTTVPMQLEVPTSFAGQLYITLGSASGRSPGIPIGALTLPLAADAYTNILLAAPNTFVQAGLGVLPASGKVAMSFGLAPGFSTSLAGTRLEHAVLLLDTATLQFTRATNAVTLRLVQ
ncbi:MAG TPA: FG-GAP-like repeat-containing protein [Planctomycetota bacterium]|nr:FG-GAP-like repeat-containing protein [Planctomycetota bacterium]